MIVIKLKKIQKKKLGILQSVEQLKPPKNGFFDFLLNNKKIMRSGAFITIVVLLTLNLIKNPLIKEYSLSTQLSGSINHFPEVKLTNITSKGLIKTPLFTKYITGDPDTLAHTIKTRFQSAGLQVTLEKNNNGWLLETNLHQTNADQQIIREIIKEFSISPPIASAYLSLLFTNKK